MSLPRKNLVFVLGTRPEAIKLAPVILGAKERESFNCAVWSTGQHRELLDPMLAYFQINPDFELNLMQAGQSLNLFASRAIAELDQLFVRQKPDIVIVQGDTTTVLATALTAFHRKIKIAHIEAGLRTFDLESPWPEEANRVIVSRLAHCHFAATAHARDNLLREGVEPGRIYLTGNPVVDALMMASVHIEKYPPIVPQVPEIIWTNSEIPVVLVTCHRRENVSERIAQVCQAINQLAHDFSRVHFVFPVHPNPAVSAIVRSTLFSAENVHAISPLDYLPFIRLMGRSRLILTDSGGVQEEAPTFHVPVLVMRNKTERPEAIEVGISKLIGPEAQTIIEETSRLLSDSSTYASMIRKENPFGDGKASERILNALEAL